MMEITTEQIEKIMAAGKVIDHLAAMTNRELVAECLNHPDDLAGYLVVCEMMSRLDPGWPQEMRLTESELKELNQ